MAPGTNHGGFSQAGDRSLILITLLALGRQVGNKDGEIESQKLPVPEASTPLPGHGGNDASECGRPNR